MNVKKICDINVNIARNLDFLHKEKSIKKAANNFKKLIDTFSENHSILFVLNSFDEIDITNWINIALEHKQKVYCLVRKSLSKYIFLKIDELPLTFEIFKNFLQPKYTGKFKKDESIVIDFVIFPMAVFDKQKYFIDNELNMNASLLLSLEKSIKIGYAYSFQSWDTELRDITNSLKIDYLITDDYFF